MITKTIQLVVDSAKAVLGIDQVIDKTDELNESTDTLNSTLDDLTGGSVTKLNKFKTGLMSVAGGFKSVGAAILLSGIGLLIVTIAAVTAAFKNSEEGQNKFAKILGVIGSITGNLIDVLAALGEKIIWVFENPKKAISEFANLIKENIVNRFEGLLELIPNLAKAVTQLFSGDFKGAAKTAADSIGKVTLGMESVTDSINGATAATKAFIAELEREAKIAADIADKRANADKLDRDLIVERAKAERDIADLKDKAIQKDKFSAAQRKQFLIEAAAINDQITSKEIAAAKLRSDAIIAENKLSGSNKEALDAEAEAKAELIRLDTKRINISKELNSQIVAINAEEKAASDAKIAAKKAEVKAEQDRIDAEQKLAEEKAIKDAENEAAILLAIEDVRIEYQLRREDLAIEAIEIEAERDQARLDLEYERALAQVDRLKGTEEEKAAAIGELNEVYAAKQIALNNKVADNAAKIAKEEYDFKVQTTQMLLGSIGGLLQQFAEDSKGAAIAGVIIDAAQAAIGIWAGWASLGPFGIAGAAIQSAALVVASAKSISAIRNASAGGTTPNIPQPPNTPTPAPQINGQGAAASAAGQAASTNALLNSIDRPIKAYVVSTEVSTQQELDRKVTSNALIG